jgi:hypothetical protein
MNQSFAPPEDRRGASPAPSFWPSRQAGEGLRGDRQGLAQRPQDHHSRVLTLLERLYDNEDPALIRV